MKRFLPLFLICLFLILIFIGKGYYTASKEGFAFVTTLQLSPSLSKQLVKNFYSEDSELRKEAEQNIKKIVLKDLNYENWIDYANYVKMSIYSLDETVGLKDNIAVVLNLSKDEGLIGVYKLNEDIYIYEGGIYDLTLINDVKSFRAPDTSRMFLVVEQTLDESFGAFFVDNYVQVFTEIEGKYEPVYRQSINYEAYYYEGWSDPSINNPKWYRLNENSIIDYLYDNENGTIINAYKNLAKYESNPSDDGTIPQDFTLVIEKDYEITSKWDEKYKYFLQGIGKVKETNQIVGIIEDSYQTVDSLLNSPDKYYKIIDNNGKINYILDDYLEIVKIY